MKGVHAVGRLVLVCAVVLVSGIWGLAGLAQVPQPEAALGTAFTYQGRLTDNGSPAEGPYDFEFKLYDAFTGGNLLGTVTPGDVPVSGGLFTVKLNFGAGLFSGDARWLEIGVRPGDSGGAYTLLDPRQELTPSPYALALPGLWTQQNGISPNLIGGYSGNWTTAGVTGATIGGGGDVNWPNRVTDDFDTVGGGQGNQAGDGDDDPTQGHATVSGGSQNTASGWGAVVGGGGGNVCSGEVATVAGGHMNTAGGIRSTVGGGQGNQASGDSTMVGGGENNQATGNEATIGGGSSNTAGGWRATVGGGSNNVASGDGASIAGGSNNVASGGWAATVGGGNDHIVSGSDATVSGGNENTASSDRSTVGGGQNNTASGDSATVAGGQLNTASGQYAAVPGGFNNLAQGGYSFAAGRSAKAYNGGCFVWGDSSAADVTCNNDNRWVARASGGVYFYTNSGLTTGSYLAAGGTSWQVISDRATKENFSPADGQAILETLASLPVQEYNLKSQNDSIRHVGLVAQDFAAFGYGESDKAINLEDADGVALAAIQGLYAENQALKAEVAAQQQQLDEVATRLAALEEQQAPAGTGGLPLGWLALGGVTVAAGLVIQRRPRGGGR